MEFKEKSCAINRVAKVVKAVVKLSDSGCSSCWRRKWTRRSGNGLRQQKYQMQLKPLKMLKEFNRSSYRWNNTT